MQVLNSLELVCMYHSGYVSLQEKYSYKVNVILSVDKKHVCTQKPYHMCFVITSAVCVAIHERFLVLVLSVCTFL